MRTDDLRTGVRNAWYMDRVGFLAFASYQGLLSIVTAIAGGPIWFVVALLLATVVPAVTAIVRRTRNARVSREFYDWLIAYEHEDEPEPVDVD